MLPIEQRENNVRLLIYVNGFLDQIEPRFPDVQKIILEQRSMCDLKDDAFQDIRGRIRYQSSSFSNNVGYIGVMCDCTRAQDPHGWVLWLQSL